MDMVGYCWILLDIYVGIPSWVRLVRLIRLVKLARLVRLVRLS